MTQFPQRKWVSCCTHCSWDLNKLTSIECLTEFLEPRKQSLGYTIIPLTLSFNFLVCQKETVTYTSQWLWGVSSPFGRCQSGVSLQVCLPPGPGPTLCPSPASHSAAPGRAEGPVRQQVAGRQSTGAALQGMWGWPHSFLPRHGFPQLLAGQAVPERKAGRREAANTATCSLAAGAE